MKRGVIALIAVLACGAVCAPASAQRATDDPLAIGRQMLAEDNPGELWIERGKALYLQKRGPRNASLEQCDLGLGPGKLEGAATRLPRHFADTGQVQDLESRLLTCMVTLQGFDRAAIAGSAISPAGSNGSDMEALALYVTSRSNGMKMNVSLDHPKEREMYKAGEYLFHRRSGQTDFACVQCHGAADKRIRLQDLVNMTDRKQIQDVVATWPAYRGAHFVVRTMQWRLYDCFWQMRLPELAYASDVSIALTTYLHHKGNGAVIKVPGFKLLGDDDEIARLDRNRYRGAASRRGLHDVPRAGRDAPGRGENGERKLHGARAGHAEKRLEQDRSQQLCSKIGGARLTQEEAAEVVRLARESMKYPATGKLAGNWRAGEKLAHDGAGDRIQFGRLEARKENGGLCQNCHALAPGEINVGNVGPSLTGYGTQRGASEAIEKLTYERIYNGWAYAPCSNMPRLGATGHLTPDQIAHLVAYLIDPQSPINRKP